MSTPRSAIHRDAHGIPHVRADSVLALARAQGEVTARDRSWQLEWLRRRATGTTAEVFGETGVAWDRFARRTMVVDTARRALDRLSTPAHDFVSAYVEGVGQGVRLAAGEPAPELVELDLEPQPWPDWMPLAVFHAQHLLFAGLGNRLWARLARSVLGDAATLLAAEGPAASGSNAWAVGGERTASGLPLIGGDPHRVIESPGVYQQVRLACDDPDDSFDVVGFAFPGVPGVQHFAHAGDVAWAITNAMADHQDVYDEQQPPRHVVAQRRESIVVRDAEPVEVDVVRTRRGLVFEDGLSLRDAATELDDLGFESLLPLLRARTVDDVDAALAHWVEPVNNLVVADVHGGLRYRVAGRVPTRGDDGEWTGWLDPLPGHDAAADGEIVTANERRGPESDAIGSGFAPPHRARRLRALLAGRDELTPSAFAGFHNDTAVGGVDGLLALVPGAFDPGLRMDADSVEAGRFAAWRSALVRRIASAPVFAPLYDPPPLHRHGSLFSAWLDPTARIALGLESLVAAGTPFGLDLRDLARAALGDVDEAAEPPGAWGETHVVVPVHAFEAMGRHGPAPLPRPGISGDSDCVRCTGSVPGVSDVCSRGAVARYVWDLADREAGGWVVPTGAHGDPRDEHHHDQLDAWVEGRLVPIVTEWEALTAEPPGRGRVVRGEHARWRS